MGIGDFALTQRIDGYWDRKDTEIDLVALDEDHRRIRFASCKRNPGRLPGDMPRLKEHVKTFLNAHRAYADWQIEHAAIAPSIPSALREKLESHGVIPQDLTDLTTEL